MPFQFDLKEEDGISLEDAIAYEFFMDNLKEILHGCEEGEEYVKALALLAKSSYLVADVFVAARYEHIEKQINPPTES